MIYVRDKGRMANNILQYGHVYAWARENGRCTVSMRFAYKYKGFEICNAHGHNIFRYLYAKYGASLGVIPTVSWDNPEPTAEERRERERRTLAARDVVVQGWNVRYYDLFLDYIDEIRQLFAFTADVEEHVGRLLPADFRRGVRLVGVHVRHGDYVRWHGGRYWYSAEQYGDIARRLVEEAERRWPGEKVRVAVCTDDHSLERSAFPEDTIFSDMGPVEDLCLLSKCDLLAGPPSTFSLTAAMYRDVPLARIMEADAPLKFDRFENLFRDIL